MKLNNEIYIEEKEKFKKWREKEKRKREKERPRFRKIAQFWDPTTGHSSLLKKFPPNIIGKLAGEDHEFPHPFCVPRIAPPPPHHPPPPSTPPTPPPSFSSGIGGVERRGRYPRRVDLKSDGLKGVFPLSTVDELSDKSIYVLANEGWKWRFLIGPFSDHSPFVNKGSGRKPVSPYRNFCPRIFAPTYPSKGSWNFCFPKLWPGLNFN